MIALACAVAAISVHGQEPEFGSEIEVQRLITEVRVLDSGGDPVSGLSAEDFRVKVGGQWTEVEAATWVPCTAEALADSSMREEGGPSTLERPLAREGRLVVLLFQLDLGLRPSRTVGLFRIAPHVREFVNTLSPPDRVAMLVMGSHLQLHADFTTDYDAVIEILHVKDILKNHVPPPPGDPSMSEHFDTDAARKVTTISRALEVTADALRPIPGPKSLLLIGWGLGRMKGALTLGNAYQDAVEALSAARTSVFSLDITDADYHSLEKGLHLVSLDTGGLYMKTHIFPEVAMNRLARVISSYYELSIIPPPDLDKRYTIKVKVNRPRTEVFVRQHKAPRAGR